MRTTSVLLLLLAGCDPAMGPGDLLVRVKSDLQPGYEFSDVRVRLVDATTSSEREQTLRARTAEHANYLSGRDVAIFLDVAVAEPLVEVELTAGDEVLLHRNALARIEGGGGSTLTVLMTRDCRAVSCPGASDPSSHTECVAGVCVPRNCSPERDGPCPVPACSRDADCPSRGVECANGRCLDGRCMLAADESLCSVEQRCSLDEGCVGAGLEPDAGP